MPNRTRRIAMLRDDILAQLRAAAGPLSTSHLRCHAAKVPVPGATGLFAPLQEQVFRTLRGLMRDQLVSRTAAGGREVTWALTAAGAAAEEIAALEHVLHLDCRPPGPRQHTPASPNTPPLMTPHVRKAGQPPAPPPGRRVRAAPGYVLLVVSFMVCAAQATRLLLTTAEHLSAAPKPPAPCPPGRGAAAAILEDPPWPPPGRLA